jgi:hypothetical protein
LNEILIEINKVESNYSYELNQLNITLAKTIENHNRVINHRLSFDNSHKGINRVKTLKNKENKEIRENRYSLQIDNISGKKSLIHKEDNPLIDKLISEDLQNLVNFYRIKQKLISKQVSNLGVILYKFSSSQKKIEPEVFEEMEKNKQDFEINYLKLMKVKKTYFKKMCEFEIYLHEKEKDSKLYESSEISNKANIGKINENNINNNKIDNQENNNNEILSEKEMIDELILLRQNYKKYLLRLTGKQKEYIDKINGISSDIRRFNIDENNLLYDILKSFDDNFSEILKELNNYCLLYEHNKKLIKNMNLELQNNLMFSSKIFNNYEFEEYVPKFKDIKDPMDLLVIEKMNKLIGFEFEKLKSNNNKEADENINYQNIDDNLLFILLMNKFLGEEVSLNQKEKKLMINLFNKAQFIQEFLLRLNKVRMNLQLFNKKENFDFVLECFNYIFSKISITNEKNHELFNIIMILSETFFIIEEDKKIFLVNKMNIPQEIKESDFWIKYLEYEINLEAKKPQNKTGSRYKYIVIISNTTHLKEFSVPKEKTVEIIEYFKNKYKFSDDEYNLIKGQLNL